MRWLPLVRAPCAQEDGSIKQLVGGNILVLFGSPTTPNRHSRTVDCCTCTGCTLSRVSGTAVPVRKYLLRVGGSAAPGFLRSVSPYISSAYWKQNSTGNSDELQILGTISESGHAHLRRQAMEPSSRFCQERRYRKRNLGYWGNSPPNRTDFVPLQQGAVKCQCPHSRFPLGSLDGRRFRRFGA